ARAAVDDIQRRGRPVLVTGGSGFYLKSFFTAVADEVAVPPAIRSDVRARLETQGVEALVAELTRLNPAGLGALDVRNPRRVTRALERCLASGRTLAELQADFAALPAPFADCTVKVCELVREPADLEARIERRVAGMLQAGLVDEVRGLLPQGLKQNPSAAGAIGYRETIDYLEGRLPEKDLAAAIAQNTRSLVKKQRTWFKTQLPAHPLIDAGSATVDGLFAPPV
ncbi:MAG: tRNA dimethylallyltransferase, partial [Oleiharenicola lentus]